MYSGKQVAMFPIPFSLQLAVHFFFTFTLFNLFLLQHGLFVKIKKPIEKNRKLEKVHLLNTQKKKPTLESKKAMILTLFSFLIWQSTRGSQQPEGNRLSVNRDDTGMGKTPTYYGRKVEGKILNF